MFFFLAMERDFFGMNGKESEDSRGSGHKDHQGGSVGQWPFSNKVTALQQLVSFKAAKEENPTKIAFDHHSTSGFRPVTPAEGFASNQKASPVQQAPQSFNLDRRGVHQFPVHAYQPQSTDSYGTSSHHVASHHSIPVATSSPFFKVYGSSNSSNLPPKQQSFGAVAANNASTMVSGIGNYTPRNVSKPSVSTSQLTIFYAGSVNVYDDVPLEKAQAIMFLASKGCNANSNAVNQRPHLPLPAAAPKVSGVDYDSMSQIPTQTQIQNPVSSPISVSSQAGVLSRSGSSNTDEVAGMKGVGQVPPSLSHHEATKAVTTSVPKLPRAVNQARKASLARFLEKRKERVTSAMPYFPGQKSSENSTGFEVEGANAVSKCPSADISLSSNQESWCLGQQRNSNNNSGDSPSTKLEM